MDVTKSEAAAFLPGGIAEVNRLMRRRTSIASNRVPGLVDAEALSAHLSLRQQVVLARVLCEGLRLPPRYLDDSALAFLAGQPIAEVPQCV